MSFPRSDWVEWSPGEEMPDYEWDGLAKAIGKNNFVMTCPRSSDTAQGMMVFHVILISPKGLENIRRYQQLPPLKSQIALKD